MQAAHHLARIFFTLILMERVELNDIVPIKRYCMGSDPHDGEGHARNLCCYWVDRTGCRCAKPAHQQQKQIITFRPFIHNVLISSLDPLTCDRRPFFRGQLASGCV